MIIIASHKRKREALEKKYPGAVIADVTSKAQDSLVRLSPFFPYGDIPVPFSGDMKASCVEAVWQGLKVFEDEGIDVSCFANHSMEGIKRTIRKHGKILGHQKGVHGTEILDYLSARHEIYIKTYRWMLEHKCMDIIQRLREADLSKTIILLDYNTNTEVDDPKKPISHAYLVKAYAEGLYPFEDVEDAVSVPGIQELTFTDGTKKKNLSNQLTISFDF